MLRRCRELALWTGALLGLLAVLAGVAVTFFGFNFLVFRSGSMSPQIPTGGLALSHEISAAQIHPGDVISVIASNGERVTHRVVSSTLRGDTASVVLKGDANAVEDGEIYQVTDAQRVIASVPYGGYVVAHALTPPGVVAAGALGLMLVVLGWSPQPAATDVAAPVRSRPRPRHRGRRSAASAVMVGAALVVVVVSGVMAVGHATGTLAYYTDKATLRSGASNAASLNAPTSVSCTGTTSATAYVTWTAPSSGATPVGYRIVYTWTNGLQTGSGTADVTTTPLRWRPDAAGLILTRTYTVSVESFAGTFISAATASTNKISVTPAGAYSCA